MEGVPIMQRLEFMKYVGKPISNFKTDYHNKMGSLRYFNDTKTCIQGVMNLIDPPEHKWLSFSGGGGGINITDNDFVWSFNS